MDYKDFTLAAVQAAPFHFDPSRSTDLACELIGQAAADGATLAAFGETWLPGYPFFVWPALPDDVRNSMRADYLASAVTVGGEETDAVCAAARDGGVDVVMGIAEKDPLTAGTVYSTLLFVSREGEILGRHRKLKPTDAERSMWGQGDGSGLRVHHRPYGRLSGLNCWEHAMMLPGYTLAAQGTQIHVAAWPGYTDEETKHLLLSRALAVQASCYVIDVAAGVQADRVPEPYRGYVPSDSIGESHVINPRGDVIAGPADGQTILFAQGSTKQTHIARALNDNGGHYSRPDIFHLTVNRTHNASTIQFSDQDELHDGPAGTEGDASSYATNVN